MLRQELCGSEASKLKLKRRAHRPNFSRTRILKQRALQQSSLEGRVALGQSSLARPGQLLQLQAPPPTGLVAGGQRRRGGRKVKSSWEKAELERKETQQDNKTTVECSCLHCQSGRS